MAKKELKLTLIRDGSSAACAVYQSYTEAGQPLVKLWMPFRREPAPPERYVVIIREAE